MTDSIYSVYNVEPIADAGLPFVVITAGDKPGFTPFAEWYVAVPDQDCFFAGRQIKYTGKARRHNVDKKMMVHEALTQASMTLWVYSRERNVQFGDSVLKHPELRETNRNFLDHYQLHGSCGNHLKKICAVTWCDDLKEYLESVTSLLPFDVEDLVGPEAT